MLSFAYQSFHLFTHLLRLLDSLTIRPIPKLIRISLALHDLHAQAFRNMERDMAMHDPSARVVSLECDDDVAAEWIKTVVGDVSRIVPVPGLG